MTLNQLGYLDTVHALGEPSLTELALGLGITKASVTVGVNKLVEQGYVVKVPSQEDKRVLHVSLTDAGNTLVRTKYQTLEKYVAVIHEALTEEEVENFQIIMIKVIKHSRQGIVDKG